VTSALVVAEGHGWFLRRYDRERAIQFLNFIDDLPVLAVQGFDGEELQKTSRMVKKFGDQRLTLADAHGLVIINERRISTCWSTDRHLGLTGAKLVIQAV
jgi:predicted nucleic acid-binding protein